MQKKWKQEKEGLGITGPRVREMGTWRESTARQKKKDGEIDIDHPDYPDDPSRRLCAEDWGSARDPRQGPMGLFPFSLPAPGAVFCMTGPGFSMHVVLFSNVPLLLPLCSAR